MRAAVVLILVAIATLSAACSSKSEGGPAAGSGPNATPAQPTKPAVDPRVARGGVSFQKYCALCHAKDGTGYAADHAPSMVNERFLRSADNAFIARSIALGRPSTPMAGYSKDLGGPLSDAEIDELVAWMRDGRPQAEPLPPAPPGNAAAGASLYVEHCQKCHGDPGNRLEAIQLGNPTFLALASDAFLHYGIVHGRPGTPMEAFGAKLTPSQIADVVAHLRSWAKPAPPSVVKPVVPPTMPTGPVVINPKGKAPTFNARDDRFVSSAEVAAALKQKRRIVIIDARPPSDWLAVRIPGSISVPHYEPAGLDKVPNDAWAIAYCACPHHASGVIVDELRKRGHKNAAILDEGILFWHKQGYPVEGTAAHLPPQAPAAGPAHGQPGHVH